MKFIRVLLLIYTIMVTIITFELNIYLFIFILIISYSNILYGPLLFYKQVNSNLCNININY